MTVMDSDSPVWTEVSVERGIKEGLGLGGGVRLAGGGRAELLGRADEEEGNAAGAGGGTEDDGGGGSGMVPTGILQTWSPSLGVTQPKPSFRGMLFGQTPNV
jgi:hypothetical protein